jgi:hypothetical protein
VKLYPTPLGVAVVLTVLSAACVSLPSVKADACGIAHAEYMARAKSVYQCRNTIGCQVVAEDLRKLNRAEPAVIDKCPEKGE